MAKSTHSFALQRLAVSWWWCAQPAVYTLESHNSERSKKSTRMQTTVIKGAQVVIPDRKILKIRENENIVLPNKIT